jgi:hypothetical protein
MATLMRAVWIVIIAGGLLAAGDASAEEDGTYCTTGKNWPHDRGRIFTVETKPE